MAVFIEIQIIWVSFTQFLFKFFSQPLQKLLQKNVFCHFYLWPGTHKSLSETFGFIEFKQSKKYFSRIPNNFQTGNKIRVIV